MSNPATFLRRVLAVDAIGCAVSGVALLAASAPIAGLTGLPVGLVEGAGAALLPFAAFLGWTASRATPPAGAVWTIIALNALWVIGSLAVAAGFGAQPNAVGSAIIVGQALAGATFAELEYLGLKRLRVRLA
jgi:hypothetical protein